MTLKVLGNGATIALCGYTLRGVEGHIELGLGTYGPKCETHGSG
jgi:hypothetical protein